jgi:WD40 repeat protein
LNNFTKGVKISPDGSCVLTNSEDNILRVFELPDQQNTTPNSDWQSALQAKEGETVYDFCWYPLMNSSYPTSCCFISSSRDHPVHLWDAFTGELRATYRAYDHLDEITSANSVVFNPAGDKIYCGFNRMVRVFDITQPGRRFSSYATSKTRKSKDGQRGIISCLAFNPDMSGMYAAGSYARTTCIYSESDSELLLTLEGQSGGVTQVQFSPDGRYLYTGGRKDNHILCWDIRNTQNILHRFERVVTSNQRVGFDIDVSGQYLVTGSQDCRALVYDTQTAECICTTQPLEDAVNGASFHPGGAVFALSTGQRHFVLDTDENEGGGLDLGGGAPKVLSDSNAVHIFTMEATAPAAASVVSNSEPAVPPVSEVPQEPAATALIAPAPAPAASPTA